MKHWRIEDVAWDRFDPAQVEPELVPLVKAAAMVERNGTDYAIYLNRVFGDDPDFRQAADYWAEEEVQHGDALGKWAMLADPSWDYSSAFTRYKAGYKLPLDAEASIRGSRTGELIARCMVETGTSSYYTALAEASAVAVAIEVPHGPVVDSLIDRGFVVHAINPKQLDRLRDRFSVAGAKDDRRDAYVLGDGVRTDRRLFRRLHVADPRLIELRAWSRLAEELQEERRRLSNRVHQQLWRYYPQMQTLTDDLAAPWFLELWTIAPTPAKARQIRKSTVEQLLKQHRIRRIDAETVLSKLREPAIKVAAGVAEAANVHMRSLVARLRVVNGELHKAEGQLDKLCMAIGETAAEAGDCLQGRDVMILKSMPGIGKINLACLISEGSGPLSSRDYPALRTLCGAAPVTRRSGKSHIVVMRYAAHVRLRNAVYHWARVATQHDPKSRSRYAALRKRGHSHGRALRGVADRLLGVACVLLRRQTLFDPHVAQPTS